MEYMPVTESMFLMVETRDQPMHVGGLQLFIPRDGQTADDLAQEFYQRLVAAKDSVTETFLKHPASPANLVGYAAWQHDDDFDFHYHVRRIVLPRPGEVKDLLRYVSLNHGALLDRSRPMWEVHVIEGLSDGRLAVYTKIHHSVVDGVSALGLLQRMLSTDPDDRSGTAFWDPALKRRRRRTEEPRKGLLSKVTDTLGGVAKTAEEVIGMAPAAAKVAVNGLTKRDFVAPMQQAPRTALNVSIGSARRFAAQDWPTDRLRAAAKRHGVTVNDVIVAMSSGALRKYLQLLDALPDDSLTAMVPVSLHTESDTSNNAVTAVIVRLATDVAAPQDRLKEIQASTTEAKTVVRGLTPLQQLALGAANIWPLALATIPGFVRLTPHAFNVIISSVPGGDRPLYWNGARLDGCYPASIAMDGQAMNITITSVGGKTSFGIIGARAQLPHLQRMLDYLEESLTELEKIAPLAESA
ncbi:MAG: wax ester/triacylglycerol synthase family O-acyltransferase [Gordonia sp. (in: high G+C Gram-positive bacteria)]|uniref:WS/DGAT/MGAT family O-acyltransferase n=1 Tax=Gordonia sp. (in: high G+C Gram-positive bacteria) TaxID=84139 RepID=UPI0039E25D11